MKLTTTTNNAHLKRSLKFLVMLSILFAVAVSAHAQSGNWSSGDRNINHANRPSMGWKKIGSAAAKEMTMSAFFFPPAMASGGRETGVMWAVGKTKLIGRLWKRSTAEWSSPTDITFNPPPLPNNINFMSSPALVHRALGLFDVVVLGFDQYYHAHYVDGKWSNWEGIGGMGQEPAISFNRISKRLDVWVIGNGSVWRRRWEESTGWQSWGEFGRPPGVTLTAGPGVTVRPDGTVDIVAPSLPDGQLWHAHVSPADQPSAWETIPGKTFRQPALSSNSPDRLDVWVTGAQDNIIFHETWTPGPGWSEFDISVNQSQSGTYDLITSAPAVDLMAGITNVAAINKFGEVLVRSFATTIDFGAAPAPKAINIRRPMRPNPLFIIESSAENAIAAAPACNSVYLSLGNSGDLQKQKLSCVINGIGTTTQGAFNACESQSSTSASLGSTDNQVAVLKNGTVLLLRQGGGINTATSRTGTSGRCRGTENVFFASSCGTNWSGPVVLDPCDPNGPFDSSFCNTDANNAPPCTDASPLSGTDRPEMLASRHDGSVYVALGVAGANGKYNLVLMRSNESNLNSWKTMDTGLGSGGAVSLAESKTHLYLSRCEFGPDPFNVGLYAYRKDKPFTASSLVFMGNIADASCKRGDVNMSMMQTPSAIQVVRWVIPFMTGSHERYRRGFSFLTPGGPATIHSFDYVAANQTRLPTLVAIDYDSRALLYWYELGKTTNTWRVMGSVSDGLGRWSPAFALSGNAAWGSISLPPWSSTWPIGHDYMKGYPLSFDTKRKFIAQWIQPVGKNNEIFYGIVDY